MAKKKKNFYAIKEGRGVKNIIVRTWDECKPLIHGYDAEYKGFSTEEEAKEYLFGKASKANKINEKAISRIEENTYQENKNSDHAKKPVKTNKSNMILEIEVSKSLYQKYKNRCKVLGLNEKKTLKRLMVETFEEWIED